MTEVHSKRRKNAREDYRRITDAEAYAQELEELITNLQAIVGRLIPEHEKEMADREASLPEQGAGPSGDILGRAMNQLAAVKGRMYLERVMRGLSAKDICKGSGWGEHTLRQFENRESDAMVSSLYRYAAGLNAAGIKGRVEIRWVPEEPAKQKGKAA